LPQALQTPGHPGRPAIRALPGDGLVLGDIATTSGGEGGT
jgi:hypothetical protein